MHLWTISRTVSLMLLSMSLLHISTNVHARSPHLPPSIRKEISGDRLSCMGDFLAISMTGLRPEVLLTRSLKTWDRASGRLGYLPFAFAASASIELTRDLNASGSHHWNLILRAIPCSHSDIK